MTPPAASTAARLRRSPAPRAPRRVSGPARPMRAAAATAGAAAPLALRLGGVARRVPDARLLDRLIRGRAWIALVAGLLLGIVFMQVSMLKLNTGISRSVATETALERQNSILRAQLSGLGSGARIQDVAAQAGMLMAPAGEIRFLGARSADAARAAANITVPNPVQSSAQVAAAATTTATGAATAATTLGAVAPASTTTGTATPGAASTATATTTPGTAATTTPASTATTTTTPATTAAPPAQQQTPGASTGAAAAPGGGGQ